MENDIFNFEDFIKGPVSETPNLIKETTNISNTVDEKIDEDDEQDFDEEVVEEIQVKEDIDDTYYKIYSDKSEEFCCDISIQGANQDLAETRLVIESEDWSLIFNGEIKNGKCIIPIKKLNILKEGQVGKIKLEVIAEGNIFIPWEDKFKVNLSKKVTVKLNESREIAKKPESKIDIKVGIRPTKS